MEKIEMMNKRSLMSYKKEFLIINFNSSKKDTVGNTTNVFMSYVVTSFPFCHEVFHGYEVPHGYEDLHGFDVPHGCEDLHERNHCPKLLFALLSEAPHSSRYAPGSKT